MLVLVLLRYIVFGVFYDEHVPLNTRSTDNEQIESMGT